jgi:hypothetical protein
MIVGMKRTLGISLLVIAAVSCPVYAQDTRVSEIQLHARKGPPPQPPNEQLLPDSSVTPIVVPNPKKYPQKYAAVYMPVSLAVGRVRTPEFRVSKGQWYDIVLQVEVPPGSKAARLASAQRLRCMTGATLGPLDERECGSNDRVLRADWTVWEGGRIVHWGSIPDVDGGKWGDDMIIQIGAFGLETGKEYVVQMHFTNDGTALNAANPHLIVIPHQDMY